MGGSQQSMEGYGSKPHLRAHHGRDAPDAPDALGGDEGGRCVLIGTILRSKLLIFLIAACSVRSMGTAALAAFLPQFYAICHPEALSTFSIVTAGVDGPRASRFGLAPLGDSPAFRSTGVGAPRLIPLSRLVRRAPRGSSIASNDSRPESEGRAERTTRTATQVNAVAVAIGGTVSSSLGLKLVDSWVRAGNGRARVYVPAIGSLLSIPFAIVVLFYGSAFVSMIAGARVARSLQQRKNPNLDEDHGRSER